MQRRYGLREAEKHPDDATSVATWVKEYEAKENGNESSKSPFFCYRGLEEENGMFTLGKLQTLHLLFLFLSVSVPFSGIQTEFQEEMLKYFGQKAICVDATHKTTMYDNYLLVTILVVADHGKGYPVVWFVVSQETKDILSICFTALRDRYDKIFY